MVEVPERVVTLDLSFSTGWCSRVGDAFTSGVQRFPLERGRAPAYRFFRFRRWLEALLPAERFDLVIYEQPHLRGWRSSFALVTLAGIVEERCALIGAPVASCHTGTLKKEVTGRGGASKTEMMAATRRLWPGWTPETDDEADARGLQLVWNQIKLGSLSVRSGRIQRVKGRRTT